MRHSDPLLSKAWPNKAFQSKLHVTPRKRVGANVARLLDAIRVMPGLVPGIHVVMRRAAIRTSIYLSAIIGDVVSDLLCASRRGCPGQARA
jgi:hypothetical protein